MSKTEAVDIQAAQIRFLASTDRLLAAAEQARRDREEFFRLIRREAQSDERREAAHAP